jgi:hypothetical protein
MGPTVCELLGPTGIQNVNSNEPGRGVHNNETLTSNAEQVKCRYDGMFGPHHLMPANWERAGILWELD